MNDPGDDWARNVLAPLREMEVPSSSIAGSTRRRRRKFIRFRLAAATLLAVLLTVTIAWAAQRGIFAETSQASIAPSASDFNVAAVFTSGPGEDQDIGYLDTGTGRIEPLVVAQGDQSEPVLSPDGRTVFYVSSNGWGSPTIQSISLQGGAPADVFHLRDSIVASPTPSPIGDRLLVLATPRQSAGDAVDLWVMGADGAEPRRIVLDRAIAGGPFAPRWSPDGKTVLVGLRLRSGDPYPVPAVIDLEGRITLFPSAPPMAPAAEAAWDPDGTGFAYVALENGTNDARMAVVFVDLTRGAVSWRVSLPDGREISHLRFSPDGTQIAAISDWVSPQGQCTDEGYTYPCREEGLIVFRAAADAEPTLLARGPGVYGPLWARDGLSVLFWRTASAGAELDAVSPDGQETTLIGSWESNLPEDEGAMQLGDSSVRGVDPSPGPSSQPGSTAE
jgi:dipeptidyl aminopeptidase/acylaminoacyl peptidase